jgi:hypothetical protein
VTTTTQLASSANPAFDGDTITLTATVMAGNPNAVVAGSVKFSEGSTVLAMVPVANGAASVNVMASSLGVGTDPITAQFTSTLFAETGSSATLAQVVNAASDAAVVNGGNNFNGNQTVNGTVFATSFTGNGSGLANVTAAGLACTGCITNYQLGIDYAGSNAQGGAALNALALGGLPSTSFATTASNSFTGDQIVAGKVTATGALQGASLTIGGGTPITEYLSMTMPLVTPKLAAGACTTIQSPPLNGFTPGTADTIALGIPNELIVDKPANVFLMYQAWETAAAVSPTITILVCNQSSRVHKGGNNGTIRIDVFKH